MTTPVMVSGQVLSALFGRLLRPLGSKYEANTFDVSFCYGLSGGGPEDYVGTKNSIQVLFNLVTSRLMHFMDMDHRNVITLTLPTDACVLLTLTTT